MEEEQLPEQTSWKTMFGMAFASIALAVGSIWFLTSDFDLSSTVETTAEVQATATPEPEQDLLEEDVEAESGTDDTDEAESGDGEEAEPIDLGDLFRDLEVPTPKATSEPVPTIEPVPIVATSGSSSGEDLPVLPRFRPRPRVTTIPTRAPVPTRVPVQAPAPAPVQAPAPAQPAPAAPQVVYVQPPQIVYVQPTPVPAPVYVPAPAPVNAAACPQFAVGVDYNRDGVADGTLPGPCGPCPNGTTPVLLPGDNMLDC